MYVPISRKSKTLILLLVSADSEPLAYHYLQKYPISSILAINLSFGTTVQFFFMILFFHLSFHSYFCPEISNTGTSSYQIWPKHKLNSTLSWIAFALFSYGCGIWPYQKWAAHGYGHFFKQILSLKMNILQLYRYLYLIIKYW